jgi:hypothetical protein
VTATLATRPGGRTWSRSRPSPVWMQYWPKGGGTHLEGKKALAILNAILATRQRDAPGAEEGPPPFECNAGHQAIPVVAVLVRLLPLCKPSWPIPAAGPHTTHKHHGGKQISFL